ncbi:hypothetical protein CALVIDRAFT_567096 [Calocera viscosa TUFC12733]|uniref:Uncharacterized protein n=1 Tax=Calocera viscosa (strain TUFC12733) TaxID=1330018 RepID=A0A167IN91_CALVF|nr:hypothetical protein CALVIDRAFT_567096 [Calocera viscosa TUFC12733]
MPVMFYNPFSPVNGELPSTPASPFPFMRLLRNAAILYHELVTAGFGEERARLLHLAHLVLHYEDARAVLTFPDTLRHLDIETNIMPNKGSGVSCSVSALEDEDDLTICAEEYEDEQVVRHEVLDEVQSVRAPVRQGGTRDKDGNPAFNPTKLRNWVSELGQLLRAFERAGDIQDNHLNAIIQQLNDCLVILKQIGESRNRILQGATEAEMLNLVYILQKVADNPAPALQVEGGHITAQAARLIDFFLNQ